MKYCILLPLFLVLGACGDVRVEPPKGPAPTIEQLTVEKADADRKADAAIKTSADATKAAQDAKANERAALALAAKYHTDADAFAKEASDLRTAEIAHAIRIASVWTTLAGLLACVAGVFLCVRFPLNKTPWAVFISGGIVLGLGLFGIMAAPHWILAAWISGAAAIAAAVVGGIYLAHKKGHEADTVQASVAGIEAAAKSALASLWDKTQEEAKSDPALVAALQKAGIKF